MKREKRKRKRARKIAQGKGKVWREQKQYNTEEEASKMEQSVGLLGMLV